LDFPDACDFSSTHRARSSGRRMLSVVLICHVCTTPWNVSMQEEETGSQQFQMGK
jgi:hypothetical protein